MRLCLGLLFFATLAVAFAVRAEDELARDLDEQVVRLPARVTLLDGTQITRDMIVTTYHPASPGPHPVIVMNHGRWGSWDGRAKVSRFRFVELARYFARKGFAFVAPTRVGYGDTGGNVDPEDMDCSRNVVVPTLQSSGNEILEAVAYARRQPWADPAQVVLIGKSWGGIATVTAAATNPSGVVAAINFSGGIGGHLANHGVPCAASQVTRVFALLGKVTRVPNLWIYSENDQFFGAEYSKAWAEAFLRSGGPLEFHLLPPFEKDGHALFERNPKAWTPLVDGFLADKVRMPRAQRAG